MHLAYTHSLKTFCLDYNCNSVRVTIRLKAAAEEQMLLFVTLTYSTCRCFSCSWNSVTVFALSGFCKAEKKILLWEINDNSSTVSFVNMPINF